MKILHVITDLETGGVPLHLLRLATWLRDQGQDVLAVSLAPPGPVSEQLEAAGIATGTCGARSRRDLQAITRLAGVIRRYQPEVVHALLFHANLAARIACLHARHPADRLVCEIQTVEIERRWHLTLDRWTWQLCRCIVGNSPSVVDHLAVAAHIPRSNLRVIWGGVDVDALIAAEPIARSELGLSDAKPLLVWVGRLDPIKGLDVLLQAMVRLQAPQTVQLAIVGDGPLDDWLRREVGRLGLEASVRLLGMRGDVPRLLKAADAFAFPSRTEGLPNALLEAMAVGLPVVATDVPGCRDLVADGRTGLLVPADDATALATVVRRVLNQPELAACLGQAAADHVRQHHRRERCFQEYLGLYREAKAP